MAEFKQIHMTDLSWNKIKRFGMRVIAGIDKFVDWQKEGKAKIEAQKAELIAAGKTEEEARRELINEQFGVDSLKELFEMLMIKEEEFILSAVGDLFGCTAEEAGEIPVKFWLNVVLGDKYIRPLLPKWYKLELQMHSDI